METLNDDPQKTNKDRYFQMEWWKTYKYSNQRYQIDKTYIKNSKI